MAKRAGSGRSFSSFRRRGLFSRYRNRAKVRLKLFRQASVLTVAVTSLLLLFWETSSAQTKEAGQSLAEAGDSIKSLFMGFSSFLPKMAVAGILLALGWLASRLLRFFFHRFLGRSPRVVSTLALLQMGLFFLAAVASVSVLMGDIRALVGSLGLLGLALSWALQTPIESFTGWVLNTFRSYYRVGDRIEVGEVLGDVYKVDFLTTTVWEIGRPGKAVQGAQPTGAMITFPNSEILRANIINYSRDFPYVWEDLSIGFANESDAAYVISVVRKVAEKTVGPQMENHVRRYQDLLRREGLAFDVEENPQVYLSLTESYINCTIRYLVPIRSRRNTSSRLVENLLQELSRPEHRGRIHSGYPRYELKVNGSPGQVSIRKEAV